MQLTIEVQPVDGDPYTVTTNLYVVIAWERKYKRKASELANGIAMEDMAFMAFECCKQQGITVPAVFDDYVKRIQTIRFVGEEPENPS
jgi:hypothetical protein